MGSQASAPFRAASGMRRALDWPSAETASSAQASGPRIAVETVDRRDLPRLVAEWRHLQALTLEPNAFHEPAYVLAALDHLPVGRRLTAIAVWQSQAGESRRLIGLFLFDAGSSSLARRFWPIRRAWRPVYSSSTVPLVDAAHATPAITALLDHLAGSARCGAASFAELDLDGPFATILTALSATTDRQLAVHDRHARACMLRRPASGRSEGEAAGADALGAKKLKELRRLRRRLAEHGPIEESCASSPEAVAAAVETFLALEQAGWKGRAGTALLARAGTADFTRAMAIGLAAEGKCRIHLLAVGGRPVAAGILIDSRDRSWFWKTAYDEAFARYSPGLLLTLALTAAQEKRTATTLTDSCAVSDHPMIDHVWRERLTVGDIVVSTGTADSLGARFAHGCERARRTGRQLARSLFHRLRG